MKEKRTLIIVGTVTAVVFLLIFGNSFLRDRRQRARYAADREMKAQLETVCAADGFGVVDAATYSQASGLHPLMYTKQTTSGYQVNRDYYTPANWNPETLDEAELVACIVEELTELEQCSYTLSGENRRVLVRQQSKIVVTLRAAQTGEVVATSDVLIGELPEACPLEAEFSPGEMTRYTVGPRPNTALIAWLEPYVEVP